MCIRDRYKKAQTSHLPQSSNNESKKKTKHKRCRKQEARDRKKRRNIDLMYILDNDPYNVLELKPGESQESVKRSYKEKVLKAHPDKGGSVEDFLRLKTAYEILSDERKRKMYEKYGMTGVKEMLSGQPLITLFDEYWH
eukprot:TRINITY_DN615_c0_g2_i31.p1 TRINITY_DN615_c0_g2~~TRINITY_DN615_c0_g2_i31.p1  ORF type:complete len:139 (-),score=40.39 TRINITY_DN615_c0_g2_i31:121-537(-)